MTARTAACSARRRSLLPPRLAVLATLALLLAAAVPARAASPWPPSAGARAVALVAQMSLDEKLSFLMGDEKSSASGSYAGHLPGLARLGIPEFNLEDAPSGVADGLTRVTAFPTSLSIAQSWNAALALDVGLAIGVEMFGKGVNVMLGPGVNLARVPWGGRLYEYLGEDPLLSSVLVSAVITGVQTSPVTACVKHFVCNSQEQNRNGNSADVPERALRELYLPAFQAAVAAGAGSFMVGVNLVNATENSANTHTLGSLFADEGFQGWVVTDWAGIRVPNASAAAVAGTSVEMPKGYQYQYLAAFVKNGSLPEAVIDGLVARVLTAAAATGVLDTPASPSTRNTSSPVGSPAHTALALRLAEDSAVLLQNLPAAGDSAPLLPLDGAALIASGRGIAVFGDETTVVGCGSGQQVPPYVVTPAAGLFAYFNPSAPPRPAANCTLFPDIDFFQDGAPCVTARTGSTDECCALCAASPSCFYWTLVPDAACPGQPAPSPAGQCFLKPDAAGERAHPGIVSGACAAPAPGPVPIAYDAGANLSAVAALAAAADVAVVVVAATGCEGADRANLSFAPAADALVAAARAANPRTVVVTRCGGACLMPWAAAVPAILQVGLAGQEAGTALARVLMGAASPSGRLPLSFPRSEHSTWLTSAAQYPGVVAGDGWQHSLFSEGLLVGYRWFAAMAGAVDAPLFPFGHGLTYGRPRYAALALNASVLAPGAVLGARFALSNDAGGANCSEVAQLYVAFPAAAEEPPLLLKGWAKVPLPAGAEALPVTIAVAYDDLRVWVEGAGWAVTPGTYTVHIGASSEDLRLLANFSVA